MNWTPEQLQEFVTLWNDGASIEQIATTFGVTRQAVRAKRRRISDMLIHRPRELKTPLRPRQVAKAPVEDNTPGVSVLDAKEHHCRWPINAEGQAHRFCGEQKAHPYPYCQEHACKAYPACSR
jgi:hypothetical protein